MPCNCDHLEPTARERAQQRAAKLLLLVHNIFSWTVPPKLREAANDVYASGNYHEELCMTLGSMEESRRDWLLYSDARNKPRRQLADWWEEHQEEDRRRLEQELKEAQTKKDKAAAIAKLTPYERKLLGLS